MAKQTTIKTIEQNDNVSLYSICFNGDELLKQAQKSGAISIENNVITGIDTATFEL